MKKNKILALLLAVTLCVSMFAGCGPDKPKPAEDTTVPSAQNSEPEEEKLNFNKEGYPISDEGMEFNVFALKWPTHINYNDMEVFKDYEKLSNIHIQFTEMPHESVKEKKHLVFANKEGLPDAFLGQIYTNDDVLNYASQGLIIPLNDLIDKYAPNLKAAMEKYPEFRKAMTTPDGNIYALGGCTDVKHDNRGVQQKLWINQVWLDKLGEKIPTTPDELYNVLKKMKGTDLNGNKKDDEIPMGIEPDRILGFMSPWGVYGIYNVKDGKVTSGYMEPGFRDGVRWFNKLYEEGLLDIETFTQTLAQFTGKGSGAELRYGFFSRTGCAQVVGGQNAEFYSPVPPLAGPAGNFCVNDTTIPIIANKFVITSACKDPGALMRWVDYFYSTEGGIRIAMGAENVNWEKTADGKYQRLDAPRSEKGDLWPGGTAPAFIDSDLIIPTEKGMEGAKIQALYTPHAVKEYFPNRIFYTAEEVEVKTEYYASVVRYTEEMLARFITGDLDIDSDKEYNNFIQELKNIGIEELLKAEQSAYDRYIKG